MSKTYSAGIVTAYGAAKRAGYQGTYEDFCRQQAGYAESAATVEQAKNTAVSAASTATTKAGEATTAATAAQTAKTQTEQSASQALTDIATARSGAISAVQTEGATQTANATAQAQAAATSANTASTKASEASASATSAGQSATNAAASATSAANAASAAQNVLESIPQDYTDLSAEVSQLNESLSTFESCRKNIQYTLNTGFIGGNGLPNTQHANGEVYTSRIPVSAGDVIDIDINWEAQHSVWVAVATYTSDSDSAFVSRNALINNVETDTFSHSYTIPSGITHIIVTYRSYDDAVLSITTEWKALENAIQGTTISGQQLAESSINLDKLSNDFVGQSRNIFRGNWTNGTYSNDGAFVVQINGKAAGVPPEIPVIGGETYTLSWGEIQHSSLTFVYVHQFDANNERITNNFYNIALREKTLTLEANTTHLGVHIYSNTAASNWNELVPTYFQIEAGSTATEYIPPKVVSNNLIDCNGVVEKAQSSIEDIVDIVYQKRALTSNTVKSIAHRGDDVLAPQCTSPAYIMARKRGFTIAENDLWLSKDNQLVMWHDTSLARLGTNLVDVNGYLMYTDGTDFYWYDSANTTLYTHDGSDYVVSDIDVSGLTQCKGVDYSVTTLNLNVLKRIDFGVYKGDKFKGTQILTFAEWVLLCKQLGMEIYVDKKLTYTTELLTEAANTVKRLGMGDKTSWLGLNTGLITTLRTIIDGARCGILQHPTSQNVVDYASYNQGRGFFFNGDAETATAEATRIGLDAGFDVECWYVDKTSVTEANQLEAMRTLISYGMTAITLDHYKVDDAFMYMFELY